MAESKKKTLYEKMFAVMEAVDYIEKTTRIQYKTTDYKATAEEKITPIFRAEFLKNKLMVFPVEQTSEKNNGITSVDTKYKIVDIESGDSEILASSGEGADSQDKGAGKAMTYAYKYMLLRTFMSPTGEDPDKTSSQEIDDKKKKPDVKMTETQIKNLFLKYHNGDKEEAKSDYEIYVDMTLELQAETIENIKEKIKEKAA